MWKGWDTEWAQTGSAESRRSAAHSDRDVQETAGSVGSGSGQRVRLGLSGTHVVTAKSLTHTCTRRAEGRGEGWGKPGYRWTPISVVQRKGRAAVAGWRWHYCTGRNRVQVNKIRKQWGASQGSLFPNRNESSIPYSTDHGGFTERLTSQLYHYLLFCPGISLKAWSQII